MKETSVFKKISISAINVIVVIIIFIPFSFLPVSLLVKKLILIILFFTYNLSFVIFNKNRCLGMIVLKAQYTKSVSRKKELIYVVLYTASFATLLFWIFFPFDLFLFNIFALQLPTVLLKKTTLHGYLSGNITTATVK